MSAFLVSKKHIDALVTACWQGPRRTVSPGNCFSPLWPESFKMITDDTKKADQLGRMLWAENVKSLAYRYPNDTEADDISDTYRHHSMTQFLPVEVISLVHCYNYQSCEHPGWLESEARMHMVDLCLAMHRFLPGYDDAPWSI